MKKKIYKNDGKGVGGSVAEWLARCTPRSVRPPLGIAAAARALQPSVLAC